MQSQGILVVVPPETTHYPYGTVLLTVLLTEYGVLDKPRCLMPSKLPLLEAAAQCWVARVWSFSLYLCVGGFS